MDERITRVLEEVPGETLAQVAGGILGLAEARLDGPLEFTEIKKPHAEDRTIAIVRVSGTAGGRAWSSVIKLVDLAIPGAERVVGLTWPEYEEFVYERGHFAGDGLNFRPARCYAVTRPQGQLKLFWLEDLTGARGTPFTLDQIAQMARHLGEWNGHHLGALPDLGFPLGRDAYVRRNKGWNYPKWVADLDKHADHPLVRATFGGSHEVVGRLVTTADPLLERLLSAPHAFAFGDCSAGNVFYRSTETVAIDWASLTDDPIGVDGGCLIGSTFSWGPQFMDPMRAERELFEGYVGGLRSGGWHGDVADVRRAALAQISGYLIITALTPVLLITGNEWVHNFIEGRFGLPKEEICAQLSEQVKLLPGFIEEIEGLLAD
jgi:hypothetical protein